MKKAQLSVRQTEVAGYVAKGLPDKAIAQATGLSVHTIRQHIKEAAARVEGDGWPRQRLTLWFFNLPTEDLTP